LYGWYFWNKNPGEQSISSLSKRAMQIYGGILLVGTLGLGLLISQIHVLLPNIFTLPAAYPFPDAFTTTASILATILLARKQIETWILWITVDVVSIVLYFLKGINLVAIEYCIFLAICIVGYFSWKKKL
jgi:nicotinamide mononucleotide transporter